MLFGPSNLKKRWEFMPRMADKPKRTRTKKIVEAEPNSGTEKQEQQEQLQSMQPLHPMQAPTAEPKKKVKKEKKPIQVVAVVTPDGIEGTFTPEPRRPLIVHLPFKSSEVSFRENNVAYDPKPPPAVVPYDTDGQIYFEVNGETSSNENQIGVEQEGWTIDTKKGTTGNEGNEANPSTSSATSCIEPATAAPVQPANYMKEENFKRIQLLACYASSSPSTPFTPPATTDIRCFWCSHKFSNMPCFLPVKEESGVYYIYGNFCTPQCGLAYLLNEHLDSHVRWERMALLHRMYHPAGKIGSRLYPAPPRESLLDFGGTYTYEQYRQIISNNKVRVDIQMPPMISILGTLDTKPIDFYDSSLQNTMTGGFSLDRFKSWSEQGGALRLKRSKPLKDKESTLDACIQISVKRGGATVA
jgi:hypothetical protein